MRLKISHETRYEFSQPVSYALNQLRLAPKSRNGQKVLSWDVEIEGGVKQAEFVDQFNNQTMLVSTDPGATTLLVKAYGEVETEDKSGVVGKHGGATPLWFYERKSELTKPGPTIRKIANSLGSDFDNDVDRMHALAKAIQANVQYETGTTEVTTTAEEAAAAGHGVCQDHAQIFVSAARYLGYPARYVSGYLMMNDRVHQDASHAWAEVYVDALGWVGFDISNAISPDSRYVAVATGLDYDDAAPISGLSFGPGAETLEVTVQVQQ
ncbi:transglutaminase family protein [Henriciella sp. AS95]|uniref:transglutaminase family protein n=1 Tax=Henriciella sp. AS95 TaxID=3135782 RepID=UPI0031815402